MDNDSHSTWRPNDEDESSWKTVVASSIFQNSKLFAIGEEDMSEETRQQLIRGEMPTDKAETKFGTSTVRHYKLGWTNLMNVLSIIHKRPVRMADFFKFGQKDLIEPTNLARHIENHVKSIGVKSWTLRVHAIILSYQADSAMENKEKFLPIVRNKEDLTDVQLQKELEKEANELAMSANNVIAGYKNKKVLAKLNMRRKAQGKYNKEAKSQFEDVVIPDPRKLIPAYLSHPQVKKIDREITQASESQTAVSAETLKRFGDHLLRRLIPRNPHRKQVISLDNLMF